MLKMAHAKTLACTASSVTNNVRLQPLICRQLMPTASLLNGPTYIGLVITVLAGQLDVPSIVLVMLNYGKQVPE